MIFREIKKEDFYLIKEYKNIFITNKENIPGAAGLETTEDINKWIDEKLLETSEETILNKNFVPAHTFVLIDDNTNKLVGIINIRHTLNDFLLNFGGHIGYSVEPSFRKNGYGKYMLEETLKFAFNNLNLDKVLITCDTNNIASEKTILSCGGKLENIIVETNRHTKRFWIYKK